MSASSIYYVAFFYGIMQPNSMESAFVQLSVLLCKVHRPGVRSVQHFLLGWALPVPFGDHGAWLASIGAVCSSSLQPTTRGDIAYLNTNAITVKMRIRITPGAAQQKLAKDYLCSAVFVFASNCCAARQRRCPMRSRSADPTAAPHVAA